MSEQYVAVGAPALFVGLAAIFERARARAPAQWSRRLAGVALLAFAAYGAGTTAQWVLGQREAEQSYRVSGGRLIVDVVDRGLLPALLWHVGPDTQVYADARRRLIASPPPGLVEPGPVILFESRGRRRSRAERAALHEALRAGGREPRAIGERVVLASRSGRARTAARVHRLELRAGE